MNALPRRVTTRLALLVVLLVGAPAAWATSTSAPVSKQHVHVASPAKAGPILLPTVGNQWSRAFRTAQSYNPPAPPCPESGKLPGPFSNCGLPEFPAVGQPYPGNMAYWGGHVQLKPKIYLVLWGWGREGAFNADCARERVAEPGLRAATLKCDPDGTGKLMADFISQLGGTAWAGLQTQYYDSAGRHITNPRNQLGGIWVDDSGNLDKAKTNGDGSGIYRQLAQEAARAVGHFRVGDLADADFVIAQPQNYSDPIAQSSGYCAFHDYTEPVLQGGVYNNIRSGISYTNMPYILNMASSCGANLVNSGPRGKLDPVTIALGHEIEETVTDPGAEDILPNGTAVGGWYDPFDANENGDKCAYVGMDTPGEPGSAANIRGNRGTNFPVQSLWSNQAVLGAGWCAGAGTDMPVPNG